MARKASRNSRRGNGMKKIEPAVQTFAVAISGVPGFGSVDATADLSQIASICNRRFYRQGLNWAVAGFKILSQNEGNVEIHKLPSTWVFGNSWEKGMRHYQEMIDDALSAQESIKGRYLDFKIHMDSKHHANGFANNLLPLDADGNTATAGEWLSSTITLVDFPPNSSRFEVIGVGANFPGAGATGLDAVSLIQGYANSRALPSESDPNTPVQGSDTSGPTPENWLQAIENDGTTQDTFVTIEARQYDEPPYPYEGDGAGALVTQYPGGATQMPGLQIHDTVNFTATNIAGTAYGKGGNFPCGLIRFKAINTQQAEATFLVLIDMVPGDHRGYLAERMTDF